MHQRKRALWLLALCAFLALVACQRRPAPIVEVAPEPAPPVAPAPLKFRDCNLVFVTRDATGAPSQMFRTLFMQELCRRGILAPSFVVSYAHGDAEMDATIEAVREALGVYRRALEEGAQRFLVGPSVKPVFRPLA